MTTNNSDKVFDYRSLRLMMGLIALALPVIVSILSTKPLSSISASYYTEGRNAFVGMLFAVATLMWAYNGHSSKEKWVSKVAAIAALFVAIFPTTCNGCETNINSIIHYISATIMFTILAYFCFGPFRERTKGRGGKKGRRSKIYFTCGSIIVGCMVCMLLAKLTLSDEIMKRWRVIYWGETIALEAFGVAWFVAGKIFKPLVDDEEALKLF